MKKEKNQRYQQNLQEVKVKMADGDRRANDLAQAKDASNWLTALPLESERFVLSKREFFYAVALRYKWQLKHLPCNCAYGKTIDHALSCAKGGFVYTMNCETSLQE